MSSSSGSVSKNVCTVFIDLPGQEVQCWNTKANALKVILKKHRDVIFDIKLFKGMTYTLRSNKSEFYHADKKRLISKNQPLTFKDGEKVHLWISRDFEGELQLEGGGKSIGRYSPGLIDSHRCKPDPADKPAPFVVVLRDSSKETERRQSTLNDAFPVTKVNGDYVRLLDATPIERDFQGVEIYQIKTDFAELPREVAKFIQDGAETLPIDPGNVVTRNWCISQIVGLSAAYSDNSHAARELLRVKMRIERIVHASGPSYYLIFKGQQRMRTFFTKSQFHTHAPQVLSFSGGFGTAAGMRHAAWAAASGGFSKCGLLSIGFNIAISIAEWMKDFSDVDPRTGKSKRDFIDLLSKIGVDLAKAALSAALGTLVVGALVGFGLIAGGVAVIVGTVAVTLIIGYAIDYTDGQLGITKRVSDAIRSVVKGLEEKMPRDYGRFESSLESSTPFEFGAS